MRRVFLICTGMSLIFFVLCLGLTLASFKYDLHFHLYSEEHPLPAFLADTPEQPAPGDMEWLHEPGGTPYGDYTQPEYDCGFFSGTVYLRRNKYVMYDPEYAAWSSGPFWQEYFGGIVYGRVWHSGDTSYVLVTSMWPLIFLCSLLPGSLMVRMWYNKKRMLAAGFPVEVDVIAK